ncbi:hypothetical protein H4Q26_003213 [Puccinia striiformis f. sp. tritici PST-130]|nr:hypothetical protein H4Q26_003213 [Puccinia striiformis f. sp. tritici PST-130]
MLAQTSKSLQLIVKTAQTNTKIAIMNKNLDDCSELVQSLEAHKTLSFIRKLLRKKVELCLILANNPPTKAARYPIVLGLQQEMAELRQELQAARQAPPPPVPIFNNREEQILLSFLRAPMKTHKEHNKNHPVLSFLGENFPQWQKSIDRTLRHAFCLNHSWFNVETNFDHVANDTKSSICGLLRNTIVDNLSALVEISMNPVLSINF